MAPFTDYPGDRFPAYPFPAGGVIYDPPSFDARVLVGGK
jgi:hypothetical protein